MSQPGSAPLNTHAATDKATAAAPSIHNAGLLPSLLAALEAVPAGLLFPWELCRAFEASGIFSGITLYYPINQLIGEAVYLSGLNPGQSCRLDAMAERLPSFAITAVPLPVLRQLFEYPSHQDTDWLAAFSGDQLEDEADTAPSFIAALALQSWIGLAIEKSGYFLLLATKYLDLADSAFSAACQAKWAGQGEYVRRLPTGLVQPRLPPAAIAGVLRAEASQRQSPWVALYTLSMKPFIKSLTEQYGERAASCLLSEASRLLASLVQVVGQVFPLPGGRLLLAYYGHSSTNPELLSFQIVKSFFKNLFVTLQRNGQPLPDINPKLSLPEAADFLVVNCLDKVDGTKLDEQLGKL